MYAASPVDQRLAYSRLGRPTAQASCKLMAPWGSLPRAITPADINQTTLRRTAPRIGLEPTTFGSATQRSNPLSYRGKEAEEMGFEPMTEV